MLICVSFVYLHVYSILIGFVSWRNSEQGSWFIQALCEVFAKHCHHEDAVNMLVQVCKYGGIQYSDLYVWFGFISSNK